MMAWNYRVVKHISHPEHGDEYAIFEVYYDKRGKPEMMSFDPIAPHGETVDELKDDLDRMIEAFGRPVFEPPKEWGK